MSMNTEIQVTDVVDVNALAVDCNGRDADIPEDLSINDLKALESKVNTVNNSLVIFLAKVDVYELYKHESYNTAGVDVEGYPSFWAFLNARYGNEGLAVCYKNIKVKSLANEVSGLVRFNSIGIPFSDLESIHQLGKAFVVSRCIFLFPPNTYNEPLLGFII